MKTFARIILINLAIYAVYMISLVAMKNEIVGAPLIFVHAIVLFVVSGVIRNPRPILSAEMPPANELETYKRVKQLKQAYLLSALLILLLGMPLCFVLGVSDMKVQ